MLVCVLHVVQFIVQIAALIAVPLTRSVEGEIHVKVCPSKFPVFLQHSALGHLSVDLWVNQCGTTLTDLRENPEFPLKPTHTALMTHTALSPGGSHYAKRVVGLLLAPVSGEYMFSGQGSGEVELWLSIDDKPENSRRLLAIASERQTAPRINLAAHKSYYIEILQTVVEEDSLQILWHVPNTKDYKVISEQYLSPHVSTISPSVSLKTPSLPTLPASPQPITLLLLPSSSPSCTVSSSVSSIIDITPGSVHPSDYTDLRNMRSVVLGNQMIHPEQAEVLKKSLITMYPTLTSVESLELYPNGALWLEGRENGGNRVGSWSALDEKKNICDPGWIERDQNIVTFIVGVKGQITWVNHLLKNMAQITDYSIHITVNLIIVDFDQGAQTQELVQHSTFKNVKVVPLTGNFDRGLALAKGSEHAADGSLIFFIDLHLQLPPDIAERAWARTVRGKSVYAPVLVRLNPGHTPYNPNGYWEMGGYGLLALYKSDYIRSDGHLIKPTYTWGGEDWTLVDKLISKRLVVLRARVPGLYHYHHDRTGMWNRRA